MHRGMTEQPILTISILISNHYDNVKRCLDSMQPLLEKIPSELILTDTGVDRELRHLLESYTDHIIDFVWCQDFSAARNMGLKEAKGQWFLYIDDDEWFEDTTAIVDFLQSREESRYNVACYIQRNYQDFEGTSFTDHIVDRILRIQPQLHFEHRIHEAYTGIEIKEKKQLEVIAHHYGYCYENEEQKMEKHLRNQKLLELECEEHPEDMRMRYQMVINPYTVQDWDTSIGLALDVIREESDSEYWDACHTSILYCLEKKGDWEKLIAYGDIFLQKNIFPFDRFGIMQFMIDGFWNTQQLNRLCAITPDVIDLYAQYKSNPQYFNQHQLMRTTFVENEYLVPMLMYMIVAALGMGRGDIVTMLSTGATASEVANILQTEETAKWIEENVAMICMSTQQ